MYGVYLQLVQVLVAVHTSRHPESVAPLFHVVPLPVVAQYATPVVQFAGREDRAPHPTPVPPVNPVQFAPLPGFEFK